MDKDNKIIVFWIEYPLTKHNIDIYKKFCQQTDEGKRIELSNLLSNVVLDI